MVKIEFPDTLPISSEVESIQQLLQTHQVIIVAGETGSGKSTQLAKICLAAGRGDQRCIGHTQPRRLAARSIAQRIAQELQTPLGTTVGYQVRFHEQVVEHTQIKVMTDGILLNEVQHDPLLKRYDTLIIDEAHERSLTIDFLLGVIKRLLPKRPDLRVIITSATLDHQRFSVYFNDAPIVTIAGRSYPVTLEYLPWQELDEGPGTQPEAIWQAIQIVSGMGRGDILVFLPTERDIHDTRDFLRKQILHDSVVLPLYARLSLSSQQIVFSLNQQRKIVLATNVAETSITVPGIHYVIDTGTARQSMYSYRNKVQRLPIVPISQAAANQRAGRCGRVAPGVCVRLYAETDFQQRPVHTTPEILRTNLSAVILQMAYLRLGDIEGFPFIESPDSRYVRDGYHLLEALQAMAFPSKRITSIGKQLARFPLDPRLARMLIAGRDKGCLAELLVIVSALAIQDPRERPPTQQQKADQCHQRYQQADSDLLSWLILWQDYHQQTAQLSQNKTRQYCQVHYLSYQRMREWRQMHTQLAMICKQLGWSVVFFDPEQGVASWLQAKDASQNPMYQHIHQALLTGCLNYIARITEQGDYVAARQLKCRIFPGSNLAKRKPKWLMAAVIVETQQLFARQVALIQPDWIEPLAMHLVKRHYHEPFWSCKRAAVLAYETVTLYGLTIVNRRRVHYLKIDPLLSRELFIRHALVRGEWDTDIAWVKQNQRLVEDLSVVEDKARRRDLLVDEAQLVQWYLERLPQEIVDVARLQHWVRDQTVAAQQHLYLQADQVLSDNAQTIAQQYPDTMTLDGIHLPLTYHFEPGSAADGVTVTVPLTLLGKISAAQLSWLVPALLEEKMIALIRGLPKAKRRHYVPAPNFACACLEASDSGEGSSVFAHMAQHLTRMTGVPIDSVALQQVSVSTHLLMRIAVIDADGQVIASGRDLPALQQQLMHQVAQAVRVQHHEQVTQIAQRCWQFAPLPQQVTQEQHGITMPGFPGLQVVDQGVITQVFATAKEAAYQHHLAVRQLLAYHHTRYLSALKCDECWQNLQWEYRGIGSKVDYWQDLWYGLIERAWLADINTQSIRDAKAFRALCEQKVAWQQICAQLLRQLEMILARYQQLSKVLSKKNLSLLVIEGYQDLQSQLQHLCQRHFICQTPLMQWRYIPIYLNSMLRRVDRLNQNPDKDRINRLQVQPYWQTCLDHWAQCQLPGEWLEFRWLVESWRLKVFTPELKALPVTEKQIKQQWRIFTA